MKGWYLPKNRCHLTPLPTCASCLAAAPCPRLRRKPRRCLHACPGQVILNVERPGPSSLSLAGHNGAVARTLRLVVLVIRGISSYCHGSGARETPSPNHPTISTRCDVARLSQPPPMYTLRASDRSLVQFVVPASVAWNFSAPNHTPPSLLRHLSALVHFPWSISRNSREMKSNGQRRSPTVRPTIRGSEAGRQQLPPDGEKNTRRVPCASLLKL